MLRTLGIAMLLALFAGEAFAQGLGLGLGLSDLRMNGVVAGGGGGGCATNFVFDWSDTTGCDAITAVLR
jgi:hypothetical protein